jgi:hypothetical protein
VGVAVKHRQLAHQVGVFIEDPLANLRASFNLSVALQEGTTSVFGSWVHIAKWCRQLPS